MTTMTNDLKDYDGVTLFCRDCNVKASETIRLKAEHVCLAAALPLPGLFWRCPDCTRKRPAASHPAVWNNGLTLGEFPGGGWWGPLTDCGEHVLAALHQLLSCPEIFRPFVVVEVMGSGMYVRGAGAFVQFAGSTERGAGAFVQFAGSTERGLLLDVPALGIKVQSCPTPEDGVNYVLTLLRKQGVPETGVVRVRFESTRKAPGPSPAEA